MARYYMPAEGDSYLKKVWTWATTGKRFRPSFPRTIEFQTLSTCNAKCIFCPHKHSPKDIPHGRMDDALFRKIVDECARHFVGRVSPYLTNEPLMDKRMPEMLRYIHDKMPFFTKSKINTNAALLTEETGEALIRAGLTHLWISVNGYSPETYRTSMDLDLDRTLTNIDTFLATKRRLGAKNPKVIVTTVETNIVKPELDYARKYWKERDIVFKVHAMDNRAGADSLTFKASKPKLKRNCDLFLKQAYIVENGDMIICCHDWKQTVKVGNVAETSIKEVWNSRYFTDLIRDYVRGDYSRLGICAKCSS
ncbi:radical SAM/SPASM domain-containing protein [Nitratidesulfovibrio vulgaris]|uniref:Radical SAM domain protein n=2 Tax=Nitratidesulfovibrio vulgaris TaxID=881 RepID=Q72FN1_NITV2|nr:radical SAM/SPASM domain-containing protein [Nitratidesulfovibrio vulgaris]GEB81491.1 radical SAM protein [Desulfovibrio desulfuricans]HBW14627.1 radical SAM protein [Desulfovibrio sp.]AAS94666.1 radical SAM domain protein [Nitratidesulfovibrio vulgaris str. Hildenborough]ABM29798.1 Radical SAM domain protein [Nitratidesulfovibrio vulgaris DP4]ADP85376.1 Radical SAM domain protein [Nitratidesulfovibrio vulgaris RCH1]